MCWVNGVTEVFQEDVMCYTVYSGFLCPCAQRKTVQLWAWKTRTDSYSSDFSKQKQGLHPKWHCLSALFLTSFLQCTLQVIRCNLGCIQGNLFHLQAQWLTSQHICKTDFSHVTNSRLGSLGLCKSQLRHCIA